MVLFWAFGHFDTRKIGHWEKKENRFHKDDNFWNSLGRLLLPHSLNLRAWNSHVGVNSENKFVHSLWSSETCYPHQVTENLRNQTHVCEEEAS